MLKLKSFVSMVKGVAAHPDTKKTVSANLKAPDRLHSWEFLKLGQELKSENGRIRLRLGKDGKLALVGPKGVMWSTFVGKHPDTLLTMRRDGNLTATGVGNKIMWSSGTDKQLGATLVVQGDGNMVLYKDGVSVWETGTTLKIEG